MIMTDCIERVRCPTSSAGWQLHFKPLILSIPPSKKMKTRKRWNLLPSDIWHDWDCAINILRVFLFLIIHFYLIWFDSILRKQSFAANYVNMPHPSNWFFGPALRSSSTWLANIVCFKWVSSCTLLLSWVSVDVRPHRGVYEATPLIFLCQFIFLKNKKITLQIPFNRFLIVLVAGTWSIIWIQSFLIGVKDRSDLLARQKALGENRAPIVFHADVKKRQQTGGSARLGLDPPLGPFTYFFFFFLTTLWSSHSHEPWGYLNIA